MSSAPTGFSPFYEPVQSERFFEPGRLYSSVAWGDLHDVLKAWERQMRGWYIEPVEVLLERDLKGWREVLVKWLTQRPSHGHFVFEVMAITCLLIDALSQYRYGALASDGKHFKAFVENFLPSYSGAISHQIWHYDHKFSPKGKLLTKYSEVIWNGFRCGILHEAHAPLYCGVNPGIEPPKIEVTNHATYGNGAVSSTPATDCPVIVLYPEHLFGEVISWFNQYLSDMRNADTQYDVLRGNFKAKFQASFGVDISASTL